MVAIKVFAALFAVSSVALAQYQPWEERSVPTVVQYQALDSRDAPSHVARFTEGYSPVRHERRGLNAFYSSAYSNVVANLAGNIRSVKSDVTTLCANKNKYSTQSFKAEIYKHLSACKQHIHNSCGSAHDIPHKPKPSKVPGNPPTVPGCAGQVSGVVIDVNDIVSQIKSACKGNPELEAFVSGFCPGIDLEVSDLVSSGNDLLSGLSTYTGKYTLGYSSSFRDHGFNNLLATFHL